MDQWGVGRARHRRRPRDPLRPRYQPGQHGQVAALRRPRLRVDVPLERRAPGDLRRTTCCRCSGRETSTTRVLVALGQVIKATFEPPAGPGRTPTTGRAIARATVPGPGERPGGLRLRRHLLRPDAIVHAESVIDGIEARTGAEVVVYTQLTGYSGIEHLRDRGAGARPHRPVARRAGRVRRRPGRLLRHRSFAPARPGAAVRRRPASRPRS